MVFTARFFDSESLSPFTSSFQAFFFLWLPLVYSINSFAKNFPSFFILVQKSSQSLFHLLLFDIIIIIAQQQGTGKRTAAGGKRLLIFDVNSSHDNDDVSAFSSWPVVSSGIQITSRLLRRSIVVFWGSSVEQSTLGKDRYALYIYKYIQYQLFYDLM